MEYISDKAKISYPPPFSYKRLGNHPCSLTHLFANSVILFLSLFKNLTIFMIVPPKEMLLLFSIGTFLTNYDVTIRNIRKVQYTPLYKKQLFYWINKSMETTQTKICHEDLKKSVHFQNNKLC